METPGTETVSFLSGNLARQIDLLVFPIRSLMPAVHVSPSRSPGYHYLLPILSLSCLSYLGEIVKVLKELGLLFSHEIL